MELNLHYLCPCGGGHTRYVVDVGRRSMLTCKKGTPDPSVLTHKGISPPVRSHPPSNDPGPLSCPESSRESVRPSAEKNWSFILSGAPLINEAKCAIVFGDMLRSTISVGETNQASRPKFSKTMYCPTLLSASGGGGGGPAGCSLNALPSATESHKLEGGLAAVAAERGGFPNRKHRTLQF